MRLFFLVPGRILWPWLSSTSTGFSSMAGICFTISSVMLGWSRSIFRIFPLSITMLLSATPMLFSASPVVPSVKVFLSSLPPSFHSSSSRANSGLMLYFTPSLAAGAFFVSLSACPAASRRARAFRRAVSSSARASSHTARAFSAFSARSASRRPSAAPSVASPPRKRLRMLPTILSSISRKACKTLRFSSRVVSLSSLTYSTNARVFSSLLIMPANRSRAYSSAACVLSP